MGGAFRHLIRATIAGHNNALGATSTTDFRLELLWVVVVALGVEDLVKGAFRQDVERAIFSLPFFRQSRPLRDQTLCLESAVVFLTVGFVES